MREGLLMVIQNDVDRDQSTIKDARFKIKKVVGRFDERRWRSKTRTSSKRKGI